MTEEEYERISRKALRPEGNIVPEDIAREIMEIFKKTKQSGYYIFQREIKDKTKGTNENE